MRCWLYLVSYSIGRQLRSPKAWLCLLLLELVVAVVLVLARFEPWTPTNFGERVVLWLFGLFFVPVVALVFGTGAIGDERRERTLAYLLTRPLSRWGLYLGKFVSALPVSLLFTLGGLWVCCLVAGWEAPRLGGSFAYYWEALLFGSLAYLSLFHLFGVLFRHSALVALAYFSFVEVFIGRIPGVLKRISINYYARCMVYETAADTGIEPPAKAVFLPVDASTAKLVLCLLTISFLVAGVMWFTVRDQPDVA